MKKIIFISMLAWLIQSCGENSSKDNTATGNNSSGTTITKIVDLADTIQIGTQVWMQKNLEVTTFRNGEVIPQVADSAQWRNLTTPAWCYYNNDSSLGAVYGKLYNWYAVNDPRGLAPVGYHVPAFEDWKKLETFLGGDSIAGAAMKEVGYAHWGKPNSGATNSSGFTALPGGFRYSTGAFMHFRVDGMWWSATEQDKINCWSRFLGCNTRAIYRDGNLKSNGFSVRCVKD